MCLRSEYGVPPVVGIGVDVDTWRTALLDLFGPLLVDAVFLRDRKWVVRDAVASFGQTLKALDRVFREAFFVSFSEALVALKPLAWRMSALPEPRR